MKKQYKNPIASVVKVQTQSLMDASIAPESYQSGDPVLAPRHRNLYGDENTRVQN